MNLTTPPVLMTKLSDDGHRPAQSANLQGTLCAKHTEIGGSVADKMGAFDAVLHELTTNRRFTASHLLALGIEAELGTNHIG